MTCQHRVRTTSATARLGYTAVAVGLLAAVTAGDCTAEDNSPGSPERGMHFAEQHCTSCHAVHTSERGPFGDVPTFEAVGNSPGANALALSAFFRTSHNNMPNFIISPDDTRDVIAYILSFKKRK